MSNYGFGDDYPVDGMTFESFSQYQDFTATTDKAGTMLNPVLGMAGEVAELVEKVRGLVFDDQVPGIMTVLSKFVAAGTSCETMKKQTRVNQLEAIDISSLSDEQKIEIANEAADAVWYLARFCDMLGQDFGQVMRRNVEKLSSRKQRGLLHGKGDNR